MLLLLAVLLFYAVLALISVALAWMAIARTGFVGVRQTNSRLARLLSLPIQANWVSTAEIQSASPPLMPAAALAPVCLATTVLIATLVVSFGDRRQLPLHSIESPIRSTTLPPQPQPVTVN